MSTFNATQAYMPAMDNFLAQGVRWLEHLWDRYYAYIGKDWLATGLLLLTVHELVYFGRSLPWMLVDMIPSLRKYKIQSRHVPTREEYLECLKSVVLAHIFVEAVPIFGFHFVCGFFNIRTSTPFPSIWRMLYHLALFFLLEDTWHYWGHRILHWRWLYKNVHKQHHKYAAPFGLTAEYAHPVEVAFTGTGTVGSPLLIAYMCGDMHLLTVMTWISLRLIQAIDSHSGYDFPISLRHIFPLWAGADHHDDHHHYFTGNYASSFRHWDYLLGTETPATTRRRTQKTSEAKRNEAVVDPFDIEEKAAAERTARSTAVEAH